MSNADLPLTADPLPASFTANKQTAIKGILLNILFAIRQDHTTINFLSGASLFTYQKHARRQCCSLPLLWVQNDLKLD